jgi:hypothetical protein
MKSLSRASLLLLCAPIASSCSQDQAVRRRELTDIAHRHDQDLAALQAAQSAFLRANPAPRQLEFGQDGTLLIHEDALDGPLEHEQLWTRYTWVNTTDHAIDKVWITIRLLDPAGAEVEHVEMPLELPLKFRFSPDSSYTTSIGIPTGGLHLRPGWSWDIRPRAAAGGPV